MQDHQLAHIYRAIGSIIYDWLIILGLLMIAGFVAVGIHYWVTGSESIDHSLGFQLYLLAVIFSYFLYFWKKSGQTVGMKAWKIKLINTADTPLRYQQLIVRLVVAVPAYSLLLIGAFWQYWDKRNLTWQDHASRTKLVYIPRK